jgi:Putative transposase of IS4/5 family (DUF4096)
MVRCAYRTKEDDAAVDLTDEQWAVLKSLLPESPRRADGRGRPWRCARQVLNGVLWVPAKLSRAGRWHYGRQDPQTCRTLPASTGTYRGVRISDAVPSRV